MRYSVDSSGILDVFRYYPADVFQSIWNQMDKAADDGTIAVVDEVYRELEKKDDSAFQWLKKHRKIVVDLDESIQAAVTEILAKHPRLVDTRKSRSAGDPFVIALAHVHKVSVVTGERPSNVLAKPNIPDVCRALGIPCIGVLDLFRNERWRA
jgi:hypothetical protein